jgi:hypothetical protein
VLLMPSRHSCLGVGLAAHSEGPVRDISGTPGSGRLCSGSAWPVGCIFDAREWRTQLRHLREAGGRICRSAVTSSHRTDTLGRHPATGDLRRTRPGSRRARGPSPDSGRRSYLDCVYGNRNSSAAFHPPAVSAAPDGMSLRPRVSGVPGAVLFGCPLRAPSNSKRLHAGCVRFSPSGEPENGTAEGPPSEVPCSD